MWPGWISPSSTSCTEYATSSAQSITCASRQRREVSPGGAEPVEHGQVVGVDTELADAVLAWPRVLTRRVEAGAGQVQPGRAAVRSDHFGLEPGQHPQRLRVAFEAAAGLRRLIERILAIVAKWRMSEVMREPGGVDHIGVAAEALAHLPGDLGHLQRVGEPGA